MENDLNINYNNLKMFLKQDETYSFLINNKSEIIETNELANNVFDCTKLFSTFFIDNHDKKKFDDYLTKPFQNPCSLFINTDLSNNLSSRTL